MLLAQHNAAVVLTLLFDISGSLDHVKICRLLSKMLPSNSFLILVQMSHADQDVQLVILLHMFEHDAVVLVRNLHLVVILIDHEKVVHILVANWECSCSCLTIHYRQLKRESNCPVHDELAEVMVDAPA